MIFARISIAMLCDIFFQFSTSARIKSVKIVVKRETKDFGQSEH